MASLDLKEIWVSKETGYVFGGQGQWGGCVGRPVTEAGSVLGSQGNFSAWREHPLGET